MDCSSVGGLNTLGQATDATTSAKLSRGEARKCSRERRCDSGDRGVQIAPQSALLLTVLQSYSHSARCGALLVVC